MHFMEYLQNTDEINFCENYPDKLRRPTLYYEIYTIISI